MCHPRRNKKVHEEETIGSIERIVKKVNLYEMKKSQLPPNQREHKEEAKKDSANRTRDPKKRQESRENLRVQRGKARRDKRVAKAIIRLSFLFVSVARKLGHVKLDANLDKISKKDTEDAASASSDYDSRSCDTSCSCTDCDEYSEYSSDSDSGSEESSSWSSSGSSSSSGSPDVPSAESAAESAKW